MSFLAEEPKQSDILDLPDQSATFDLSEKIPLAFTMFQAGALQLRDAKLKSEFNRQLRDLAKVIETTNVSKGVGFLTQIEIYADEFGTPVVPQGQLLLPVGWGKEPKDALAEYFRGSHLIAAPPKGLQNESYYIWIKKDGPKLSGKLIGKEFREAFETSSFKESTRRKLLGDSDAVIPESGLQSISRATYWQQALETYESRFAAGSKHKEIEALTSEFVAAEAKFNSVYKAFQEKGAELNRQRALEAQLQTALSVARLIGNAIDLGELTSSRNISASSAGKPSMNLRDAKQSVTTRARTSVTEYDKDGEVVRQQRTELERRETQLRNAYHEGGILIPRSEGVNIPRP